jgi:tetratricopeptide (TPR) repeat protein
MRGGGSSPQNQGSAGNPSVQAAYLPIKRAAERNPSPENCAALAVFDIVQGSPQAAVPLLRKAHADRPSDPRFLNDLAAASLAVYEGNGDPWAALEAIEVAEQADRLEPSPPARFNKALALEELNVRARAIVAWEGYLELDSDSSWAEEAEQHLADMKAAVKKAQDAPQLLTTPDVRITDFPDNPWARRQLGERVLLTRWAERTLAGQPVDAEAALEQAEKLAASLSPDGGRLLKASIGAIREAEQSNDGVRLDLLARGHQIFGQAFLRLREERAAEARALINTAISDLTAAKTPFELRARVLRAWMAEETDWSELQRIGEEADAGGFSTISAEERRIAGFRISLQGRLEAAADVYEDSLRHYSALGERDAVAVVSVLDTELLDALGRDRESSSEFAAALNAGPQMVDPADRYTTYVVAASAASTLFSRAAVELRLEAADACRGLPERPLCAVDSYLQVASRTPDQDVAGDALRQAETLLSKVPASDGKARTEIDLDMVRAHWLSRDGRVDREREDAGNLYAEAAKWYEARKLAVFAADARGKRARLLKELGRAPEAVAEYRTALQTFRLWDQLDRFRPERAEKRSPTALRDIYENLIGTELDLAGSGVSPAAFLLSEEMRDRLAPRRSVEIRLPTLADIPHLAATVPPGTAVVEYVIFGNRAAAWILAGGRLDQVKLVPPDRFGESIASLPAERNTDRWKRATGDLYQAFLAPALKRLPTGTDRLIIVPDSQLYGLPFRALWNSDIGRYLDEDFKLSLAPSMNQLLIRGGDQEPQTKLAVLSLGFGKFVPQLHLPDLPNAGDEAVAVLGAYGLRSNPCGVANWETFRRCAPQADVIHLATHATANADLSWLAFPGEIVSLERVWKELPDLPRHPVVVLAACQSAAAAKGSEGLGGLARPFLASGAREVVGSLWEVNDEAAQSFFQEFHHAHQSLGDVREALKEARGHLERWEERPWEWGAVEVINAEIR